MNKVIDTIDSEYGIFSDLPQKYAEMLSDSTYYSDAFGVFGYLMNCIDTINNLDWNIPGHQDRSIQLSLDYLYPLLKAGKLKVKVPILSLRTARTLEEHEHMKKLGVPNSQIQWFVDKKIIYSKPEEAEEAVVMVWEQWKKLIDTTPIEVDNFYKNISMMHMREAFYSMYLSFTLPHRPFWDDEQK